jgi:hypothetical protein
MSGRNSKRKLYRKHSEIESAQKKKPLPISMTSRPTVQNKYGKKKSATNKAQLNLSPAC